ncbi:hypothetical protein BD626DRAFT_524613, partial [Schizophyllum amplum]
MKRRKTSGLAALYNSACTRLRKNLASGHGHLPVMHPGLALPKTWVNHLEQAYFSDRLFQATQMHAYWNQLVFRRY